MFLLVLMFFSRPLFTWYCSASRLRLSGTIDASCNCQARFVVNEFLITGWWHHFIYVLAGRHLVMLCTNPTSTSYFSVARCLYFTELVFFFINELMFHAQSKVFFLLITGCCIMKLWECQVS